MVLRFACSMFLLALSTGPLRAPDVSGDWTVTITTSDGKITGLASFKQTGHSITGWVGPSENDPISITGTLKANRLTIKTFPQPGRTVAFANCEVTVNGDRMSGTIDTDKGRIEFIRRLPATDHR